MINMFDRMKLLLNEEQLSQLSKTNILIVGIGGVGGAAFEALVRLGIQNITLIDHDTFDLTNLNRQILSNLNNIGHSKVLEAKIRGESINSSISIKTYQIFLNESNIGQIDISQYDYIIDCCDTITTKLLLIQQALKNNIKIISSMGTGNRLDPTKLTITNIWQTNNDPIAKIIRKKLKENNIKTKIPVLFSKEIPIKTHNRTPGSISLVPNVAGFYLAHYILNDILNKK